MTGALSNSEFESAPFWAECGYGDRDCQGDHRNPYRGGGAAHEYAFASDADAGRVSANRDTRGDARTDVGFYSHNSNARSFANARSDGNAARMRGGLLSAAGAARPARADRESVSRQLSVGLCDGCKWSGIARNSRQVSRAGWGGDIKDTKAESPNDPAGRYDFPAASGIWTVTVVDREESPLGPSFQVQAGQSWTGSGNCPTRVGFVQQ